MPRFCLIVLNKCMLQIGYCSHVLGLPSVSLEIMDQYSCNKFNPWPISLLFYPVCFVLFQWRFLWSWAQIRIYTNTWFVWACVGIFQLVFVLHIIPFLQPSFSRWPFIGWLQYFQWPNWHNVDGNFSFVELVKHGKNSSVHWNTFRYILRWYRYKSRQMAILISQPISRIHHLLSQIQSQKPFHFAKF